MPVFSAYVPAIVLVMRRQRSRCLASSAQPATPIASHTAPCSPMRENRATARSADGACPRVRAATSSRSSRFK
jgi:hypothetical protein